MKVKTLIKQLQRMPQDMQVRDTFGSPIYWIVEKPKRESIGMDAGVYLEPVSQMDVGEELRAFFEHCNEDDIDEYDAFLQLGENGLTLNDFEGTEFYEMAKEFSKTHDWEAK